MIDLNNIPGTEVILQGGKRNLKVHNDMTEFQIQNLLNLLRINSIDFEIHDLAYPQLSDPGAYISYSQIKNHKSGYWSMTLGNHGWSGGIYSISENTILLQLKNLIEKKLLDEIQIETAVFFQHYQIQSNSKSVEMENKLLEIHEK